MKLYCAISPLRIFFGSVFSPLSTSTNSPSFVSFSATSDAYSLCRHNVHQRSLSLQLSPVLQETSTHVGHGNGHDEHLSRGEPEGPLASKVLRNNRDEPLQAAEDRAVNHDGARGRAARVGSGGLVRAAVLEVEALGELEVELDGRALEGAAECVLDLDVDLGAVERAVARVELPLARVELVQRLRQLLQGKGFVVSNVHAREGRKGAGHTASAWFHVSISPRKFSGRVESSRAKSNPNNP